MPALIDESLHGLSGAVEKFKVHRALKPTRFIDSVTCIVASIARTQILNLSEVAVK